MKNKMCSSLENGKCCGKTKSRVGKSDPDQSEVTFAVLNVTVRVGIIENMKTEQPYSR